MIEEYNDPLHLRRLYQAGRITLESYFFRLGAYQMNIKTYKKWT